MAAGSPCHEECESIARIGASRSESERLDARDVLVVETGAQVVDQFAERGAPVGLAGAQAEVAGGVVDAGADFVGAANALHRDRHIKIAKTASENHRSLEGGHELLAM